ncbi:MAG: flavodoxin family protein [Ectothiorhodospiraceae bacterium]|nr:flavodoxin family protein [Chromatiales bacterium]MCP5154744.1 flavodoxin family protein [Ectothiorhodospiraceae bacterium]
MKRLLVVYHSQTGTTERLALAVATGARSAEIDGVETTLLRAVDAGPGDLLRTDAVVLASPENFGYLSGGMKDFLDRTYYPCAGRVDGLPYAAVIAAGNDGTGALAALRRIARGYPLREVREPVVWRGPITDVALRHCSELGTAIAAGLELGMF